MKCVELAPARGVAPLEVEGSSTSRRQPFDSASKLDALHTLREVAGPGIARQPMECVELAPAFGIRVLIRSNALALSIALINTPSNFINYRISSGVSYKSGW